MRIHLDHDRPSGWGIAYVPRNRKENGIIKDMSILENGTIVSWPDLMRRGLLNHEKQRAEI